MIKFGDAVVCFSLEVESCNKNW